MLLLIGSFLGLMVIGTPVAVATGDNPASLYASLEDPEQEIALTIGTAAQLGVVVPVGGPPPSSYQH